MNKKEGDKNKKKSQARQATPASSLLFAMGSGASSIAMPPSPASAMLATATVAQSRARSNSAPLPGKVKLNLRCTRQKSNDRMLDCDDAVPNEFDCDLDGMSSIEWLTSGIDDGSEGRGPASPHPRIERATRFATVSFAPDARKFNFNKADCLPRSRARCPPCSYVVSHNTPEREGMALADQSFANEELFAGSTPRGRRASFAGITPRGRRPSLSR